MANRTRNIVLRVPVTAEERAMIERKMQQMGTGCFSVYARKMLIDGYVIRLDYSDVKAMTAELQKIGTNINQIAKRVNATGTLYAQDIEDIKGAMAEIWQLQRSILSKAPYTDLEQKITELQDSNEQTAAALKTAEHRLPDLALLIKHTATYKELKPLYSEYKKSHDKEKYLRGREREIILFEASARALKAAGVGDKLPDLAKLREEYSRLSEEKNRLYAEYCNCTKE